MSRVILIEKFNDDNLLTVGKSYLVQEVDEDNDYIKVARDNGSRIWVPMIYFKKDEDK